MARTSARLPKRFPVGTTYVVEARGSVQGMTLMHRYVQLPNGRRVELAARFVPAYHAPDATTAKSGRTARSRSRGPALATAERV